MNECKDYDQKSKYHHLTLDKHILEAVRYAEENHFSSDVIEALKWHDFGKLRCAVEIDGKKQYRGHESVSAQIYANVYQKCKRTPLL